MKCIEKLKSKVAWATAPHRREGLRKPNEDRLFVDEEMGIFILLDGVTRVHSEYDESPYESAALEVGDIFIEEAVGFITENIDHPDPEYILMGAIEVANCRIRQFREQRDRSRWQFYPATLGITGILRDGRLYYVGAGDCLCMLIRNRAKLLFGREWSLEALDKRAVSKRERYDVYCNHTDSELSYTVFNGDSEVMDGLSCSYVDLHAGDVLLMASDGIADYLKYTDSESLVAQTPEEMLALSVRYDQPPYAEYADDKTLIKLVL